MASAAVKSRHAKAPDTAPGRVSGAASSTSAAPPQQQHSSSGRLNQATGPGGWNLRQLGMKSVQSFLKLRTSHRFNDRLTADLGVDISAFSTAIIPRAALSYRLRAKDVEGAVLRATPSRLALLRSWTVDLKRISFRVNGSAGMTYQGNPDFSIDFGDIKPTALVVVAAAVMLTLGKPLSGAKTFGKVRFNVPMLDSDGSGTGEAKLMVKREDSGGLNVSLKQLNVVMRI